MSTSPIGEVLAESTQPAYNSGPADTQLHPSSLGAGTGGNQPIPVGGPNLAMNYIIALEGIFPSRP